MNRILVATAAVLIVLIQPGLKSLRSETPEVDRTSVSPDKKWEYQGPGRETGPSIVKAGTNQVAGDLSDACDIGSCGETTLFWAPDSQRLAFYWGQGREHHTALYQLQGDVWKALKSPGDDDEILRRADEIVDAQKKKSGVSKKTSLRLLWWTVEPDRWVDSSTLIVYASMAEQLESKELGFGGDFLFTLKFDNAGGWKIVKTHRMSEKESDDFNRRQR